MNGKGSAPNGNGNDNSNGISQPVSSSRYGRHSRSLYARVTTALSSVTANNGNGNNGVNNNGNNNNDSTDDSKYRKGRSRKRLQLALQLQLQQLQQRSLAARILAWIALGSVGFALCHYFIAGVSSSVSGSVSGDDGTSTSTGTGSFLPAGTATATTTATRPAFNYHFPHRTPLNPATTLQEQAALEELTKPLWVEQGGTTTSSNATGTTTTTTTTTTPVTATATDRSDFAKIVPQMPGNAVTRRNLLAKLFEQQRRQGFSEAHVMKLLKSWLDQADQQLIQNLHAGNQWIPSFLLPTLAGDIYDAETDRDQASEQMPNWLYFHIYRMNETHMVWEREWKELQEEYKVATAAADAAAASDAKPLPPLEQPILDYTDPAKYKYPPVQLDLPEPGTYPEFRSLGDTLKEWPQDEDNEGIITEALIHFNYSDPVEREAARKFRDAALPFKLYDVPEITAAGALWTDEYLTKEFDESGLYVAGSVQEALSNYFLFFGRWDLFTLGLPPMRYNDWNYAKWNEHAKYADASRLSFDLPHYYFQAAHFLGDSYKGRTRWSFLARDLPSFSYPAEGGYNETFFVFHPDPQRGLQCRFSERGVLSSSHYDGTRNFITMVKGAKRYILAPPRECSKLGVIPSLKSPMYRHSILNYRHFDFLHDKEQSADMSDKERAWLQKASGSQAVETVLKAGEVMYLPCNWFHYIASLQRSAQCNVRSNLDEIGNPEFGGRKEVRECKD